MSYELLILRHAQKELGALPTEGYERVRESIRNLAEEPRPISAAKLRGRKGWRLRVGSYRVIYDIDDSSRSITVLHIGHRRDVCR